MPGGRRPCTEIREPICGPALGTENHLVREHIGKTRTAFTFHTFQSSLEGGMVFENPRRKRQVRPRPIPPRNESDPLPWPTRQSFRGFSDNTKLEYHNRNCRHPAKNKIVRQPHYQFRLVSLFHRAGTLAAKSNEWPLSSLQHEARLPRVKLAYFYQGKHALYEIRS